MARLRSWRKFITLGVSFAVAGCGTSTVRRTESTGPWIGAGTPTLETEVRTLYPWGPLDEVNSYWSSDRGDRVNAAKVIDASIEFLVQRGYFARWPKGGMGYDDVSSRCIAPYSFHLVSIKPTVVVMVSADGTVDSLGVPKRKNGDAKPGKVTKYFENDWEYGDYFPDGTEILWYSPDLKLEPAPVYRTGTGTIEISAERIHIMASLENGLWKTERLR